jgi:methylenetetrahydrofolate dehydrogenase (NADP+) / methenyltetrahydrofolate cyclohydrolase / formyltetrahydrofolate synthetase
LRPCWIGAKEKSSPVSCWLVFSSILQFFNIKCRTSNLTPQAAVIVATVRALKSHGGGPPVEPGKPLAPEYTVENLDLLSRGVCNMQHHIRNALKFGVQPVVAINRFASDTDREVALVCAAAMEAGAFAAVESTHHANGGAGAVALASAVERACGEARKVGSPFRVLYPDGLPLADKIARVAKEVYGAAGVTYATEAEARLTEYTRLGYGSLPVCMAKTQYSLSTDPTKKGVPTGFTVHVRDVRLAAGAGYVYPLLGAVQTIPGLPTRPGFYDVDLSVVDGPNGEEISRIEGLF